MSNPRITPVPAPEPERPSDAARYEELLVRQIALADRQLADLEREQKIRTWSPIIRHISDVMKAVFQVGIGLGVAVLLVLVGIAVWRAAHSGGVVIEAFSVPSDFTSRGLTGQALAASLHDELAALQDATDTARPAGSYANDWGKDIKVEIPNTGMSVGEAYRLLVAFIGHETHITGEVYRTADGLTLKARVSGEGAITVKGPERDLDSLVRKAAESLYRRTQPYRFAVYAADAGRHKESQEVLQMLAADDSNPREQAWALLGLGIAKSFAGDWKGGADDLHRATARFPDLASLYVTLDNNEAWLGHDEAALAAAKRAAWLLRRGGNTGMSARAEAVTRPSEDASAAFYTNDYATALRYSREAATRPEYAGLAESGREAIAVDLALLHDGPGADAAWRALPPSEDAIVGFSRLGAKVQMNAWLGRWDAVLADEETVSRTIAAIENDPANGGVKLGIFQKTLFGPLFALAHAMTGDSASAHALIDATPTDCYLCLRVRGMIAARDKNWGGSAYWFARAVRAAPSIASARADWGRMLLAKGDAAGAAAKFQDALAVQPRYADASEGLGEALLAMGRPEPARDAFRRAATLAPAWAAARQVAQR